MLNFVTEKTLLDITDDIHEKQISKNITAKVPDAFASFLTLPLIIRLGYIYLSPHVTQSYNKARERRTFEYMVFELFLQNQDNCDKNYIALLHKLEPSSIFKLSTI